MSRSSIRFASEGVEVEIGGEFYDHLQEVLSSTEKATLKAFEDAMEETRAEALTLWPRRTGRSAESFEIFTRLGFDTVETVLTNTQRYAFLIRFSRFTSAELRDSGRTPAQRRFLAKKFGRGAPTDDLTMRHAFSTLVRTPASRRERALVRKLQAEILAIADGKVVR